MPTPTEQLLSRTVYATDGTTTNWDFSFSGGYLDKAHVKAYTEAPSGARVDITVLEAMLIGPYQLQLSPALDAGLTLTIYRDTPKDLPLVNFTDESGFSEIALDTNAKQAVFIAAETTDTVNAVLTSTIITASEGALISAAAASASAIAATASAVVAESHAVAAAASASSASSALGTVTAAGVTAVGNITTAESNALGAVSAATVIATDAATDATVAAAAAQAISTSLAGGTIGFNAGSYDFGYVADALTYFNTDLGTVP